MESNENPAHSDRREPPPRRSALDAWLLVPATGLGTGLSPWAPGTVGSLLGPPLCWSVGADGTRPGWTVLCGILLFIVGMPICNAGIRHWNRSDPGAVVFDEIAAFPWVFLFVPLNWMTAIGGFVLFRFFDILKPWPIRRVEQLPGGWGVMADDTLAGWMAGAVLAAVWHLSVPVLQ
jgi:phosphatidylglycerophosphatase A